MQLKTKLAAGAGLIGLATAALVTVMAAGKFDTDQQPIGYIGQPVPSSTNVIDGKARMFAIDYNAATLGGDLHSFPISSGGSIGTVDNWVGGADAKVAAQVVGASRKIVTFSDAAIPVGIPFAWANLSAAQRLLLDPATAANASSVASPILDYVRGVKTGEGTTYRKRTSSLGTMIHSTPVYWKDANGNETVYVGANDGMMHAFDAVTGSERFAYVPRVLLPTLSKLAAPTGTPKYMVDGRLDVRKFDSRTVLVGTLGGGGKAIFGLDVSNGAPADQAAAASKILWEVTDKSPGFANLGYTYGAPVLTRLLKKKTAASDPDAFYDALVIGNGYNNQGSGGASLYVVDAQTGAVIKEFTTPGGSVATPNGLSSPSLWDSNDDGVKDTAYAGDIDGNMWKFNLNDLTSTPVQVFAREDSREGRAITTAPGLAAHPNGGVLVAFVTGRLLTPGDMTEKDYTHFAYGIRDISPLTQGLLEQSFTKYDFDSPAGKIEVRTSSNKPMDWATKRGWKAALPAGERVVGDGIFITGSVFQFFTTNPTVNTTTKPPGENWWMQLNWRNGGSTDEVIFDLNMDAKFTTDDMVEDSSTKKKIPPVGRNMGGGVRSQLVGLSAGGVDVFQSNFDQNDAPKPDTVTVTTATVGGERGVAGGHFDTDIFCYDKCGGATSMSYVTGVSAASGQYAYGREATTGDVANQNYIHVHEYDDIYDVLGLNMLHPSQDEQRLAPTVSSTAELYAPDLPTHINNNTAPSTAVVKSTSAWSAKTAKGQPYSYSNYSEGKRTAVAGYPKTTVAPDGTVTYVAQVTYTTTRQSIEVKDLVLIKASNNTWGYNERTVVSTWTTTQTTTDTIPNTRFKVLVSNQAYSPAIKLSIDGADGAGTNAKFDDSVTGFQTASNMKVADLPAYKMNNIKDLKMYMPLDAFVVRDWANNGIKRNGVHPIKPQCAGVVDGYSELGPNGEWRNGALTVQVVRDDIAQSDIQLNVANRPDLGYRLVTSKLKAKLIAEYLIYWHHPTNLCMGDSGWTYAAAPDNKASTAVQGVPAVGAADPHGSFQQGDGDKPLPVKPATNPPPVTVTNPDGSTTTTTIKYTDLASGGYTIETTVKISWPSSSGSTTTGIITGGAVNGPGSSVQPPATPCVGATCTPCVGPQCKKCEGAFADGTCQDTAVLGRINWRELQR
jgi:type IV pilus assembly protein PilY1